VTSALLLLIQLPAPEFRPGQKLPKSPDDSAYEAAVFLKKAIETESKTPSALRHSRNLRFFSMYNMSAKGARKKLGSKSAETESFSPLDDMVKVLLFAINQTNRRNPPVTLIRVSEDLFATYLDSPGWSVEAWDSVAKKDPYFRQEWIEESTWNFLSSYTYTLYPIVRADEFVSNSTTGADYYLLLGLPKTVGEFYKQLGINEELLTSNNRVKAGVKTDGLTVTLNNRILERRQGAFDVWSSNDVVNSKGRKNALRQLDVIGGDIHKLDIDGQEHVFELGNGLWGGFLNDAKGNRVDEVPTTIANDDNYRDHRVIVGRSCITCHDQGIKPFHSDQAKLLENQVVTLRTINPHDAIALAGRYDERAIQRNIYTDQETFRAAVEDLTGTSPERIAAMYSNVWRGYAEQRVTFTQAALEAGLSNDGLLAVLTPAIDPNLLYLIQAPGRTLSRDVWEDTFDDVMLLKGRPAQPKTRINLPAVASGSVPALERREPKPEPKAEETTPRFILKPPAQIGEQQTAKIVIKSEKGFTVKSYLKDGGNEKTVMVSQGGTPTERELTFTFTSGADGFSKQVEIVTDVGSLVIPVETRP